MDPKKVELLTGLLKRLNSGENPQVVKEEAQAFLSTIDPADLSIAEQQLIDAGLKPKDLKNLCSAHMEMLSDELPRMKAGLKEGHVIHTLVSEHEMILAFLDKLDAVNKAIQSMNGYNAGEKEFGELKHIAEHLVEAEAHHKREEDVLFPAVEEKGVYGPPQVMRVEHEELRARKKKLKELAEGAGGGNFADFKKQLDTQAEFIVMTLRDHIFKENNILYPTALQVISDEKQWDEMKKACDKIGYCCFTPGR